MFFNPIVCLHRHALRRHFLNLHCGGQRNLFQTALFGTEQWRLLEREKALRHGTEELRHDSMCDHARTDIEIAQVEKQIVRLVHTYMHTADTEVRLFKWREHVTFSAQNLYVA